jgi:hypothetical protein
MKILEKSIQDQDAKIELALKEISAYKNRLNENKFGDFVVRDGFDTLNNHMESLICALEVYLWARDNSEEVDAELEKMAIKIEMKK